MPVNLQFEEVTKQRDAFMLSIPEMTIEKGEILGVIGNNGAGKSTMIQLVLGLIQPTSGTINRYIDGDLAPSLKDWKHDVGFVFDDLSVYEDMHLTKLASFLGEVYPDWDDAYYFSLLEKFDVDTKKKIKKFSRGMRMKAGIAVALAHHPNLLLLDEPTSGLDTKSRKQMITRLQKEHETNGTTIIFSSHILSDMEQLATSVWLMDKGEILLHGDVDDLQANHAVAEDGTIHKEAAAKEGMRQATLEELHDYYLSGDAE
ncbi:ABC transporter ATP-binding protein [Virgibacillus sp. NKC19-3]|uniref:ABC transporter ATP-binding protein n=1 Tax=Virgibacillus saliphilus TaxID=2831674 RepID=UPI001C9AE977|nr:ABC transporter ATP-binding protein [Virgibacillus sp. NKC19-3]MBY7143975.1 ABC transporter ATP-binding protein [Virgibacillus sp. NKC19-3]